MIPGEDDLEAPETSIEDVVRAAYEQHTKEDDSAPAKVSSPEAEVSEVAQERPRDASGKFLPKSAVEQQEAAPEPVIDADPKTEQPVQQSSAATPPSFLSAEAKAEWAKTPPAIQAAIIKRDVDANEGGRQWSEQRRAVEQAISPLHELSQRNGIHWQEGLNRLLTVESGLSNTQTREQTIADLIAAYPIDPARLAALINGTQQPSRPAPQFDPNAILQSVDQRVNEALVKREVDSAIQNFSTERDPNGNLKYPHFEELKPVMGFLMTSQKAATMEEAYQKAVWMNPEMRPAPAPVARPQAQQVAIARKAAVSVKGAPSGRAPTANGASGKSLDDIVREAYSEHAGQAN